MMRCPFCSIKPQERVIHSDKSITAFLSRDAITSGQTIVIPTRHAETILDLTDNEISEIFGFCKYISKALIDVLEANGTNIICNNGIYAGQTVNHFHVHVVPRYKGDIPDPRYLFNPVFYEKFYRPCMDEFKRIRHKLQERVKIILDKESNTKRGECDV